MPLPIKAGLFVFVLTTNTIGIAQTNLGFNSWMNNEPTGWQTVNFITNLGGPQTVFQEDSTKVEGSSSCKITTAYWGDTLVGIDTVAGLLLQQSAYSTRPHLIYFQFISQITGGDTGIFRVQLTRWDTSTSSTIIVGSGQRLFASNDTSWNKDSISITYYSSSIPDTLLLIATPSNSSIDTLFSAPKVVGSTLYLDSLALNDTTVSILNHLNTIRKITPFPNPATTFVQFNLLPNEMVYLYDLLGQRVAVSRCLNDKTVLDVCALPVGVYIYRVSQQSQPIQSGKIIVSR